MGVGLALCTACSRTTAASSGGIASQAPTVERPPAPPVAASVGGSRGAPGGATEPSGWALAFASIEAESEAARAQGKVVRLTPSDAANATAATPALEASGRGYLSLEHTGDFLELRPRTQVNGLVIRYAIPDAEHGGGERATLGLYVGTGPRRSVTLSSRHAWLYGDRRSSVNGQHDEPGPAPHVFWQETRVLLDAPTEAAIRIQRDASDAAAYYYLDVIDTERVAPPLPSPPNALSVSDCGARGDGKTVDTAAILQCAGKARQAGRILYFPAGHFVHDARIPLDGLHVQGAGVWYTTLVGVPAPGRPVVFGMYLGFSLDGRSASVSDLSLTGSDTSRTDPQIGFVGYGDDWRVERVWLSDLGVGFWVGGHHGVVSQSRVRDTYADGININNGQDKFATDIVVEHNHVRGTGDDGIAVLSHARSPHPTERVRVTENTVVAPWWGHNLDLGGGIDIQADHNYLADSVWSACLAVQQPPEYAMSALEAAAVSDNVLDRCGGNRAGQRRGAIWLNPETGGISGLTIARNRIEQPLFSGIDVRGPGTSRLLLRDNTITHPGEDGIFIHRTARCRISLSGNAVQELGSRGHELVNEVGDDCVLDRTPPAGPAHAP